MRKIFLAILLALFCAPAFAAIRTWDFGASTANWSDAANWSDDTKPVKGDDIVFDDTSDEDCTVDEAVPELLTFTVDALYDGTIDLATYSLEINDVILDGGTAFLMGSGTMTVSNFDNKDQTGFDAETSTLVLSGDGDLVCALANTLHDVAIDAGVTTTVPSGSAIVKVTNTFAINGELEVTNNETTQVGGGVTVGAAGIVSGAGTLTLVNPGVGDGITSFAGTITITNLVWMGGTVDATLAPGVYAPELFKLRWNEASAKVCKLSAGEYEFSGDVKVENINAGGSMTWDLSANPDVCLDGDMIWTQTGGTCAITPGTGILTLGGGGEQAIDFGGETINPLVIDKSAGTATFGGNAIMASFLGTAGTLDPNSQTLETTGDFTTAPGFVTANAADVMNGCDITVGGDLSLQGNGPSRLNLKGSAGWVLDVAGAAAVSYANVSNSDASGGSSVMATNSLDYGDNTNWRFQKGGVGGMSRRMNRRKPMLQTAN